MVSPPPKSLAGKLGKGNCGLKNVAAVRNAFQELSTLSNIDRTGKGTFIGDFGNKLHVTGA